MVILKQDAADVKEIGLTHLKYKIKHIWRCDWFSVLATDLLF